MTKSIILLQKITKRERDFLQVYSLHWYDDTLKDRNFYR